MSIEEKKGVVGNNTTQGADLGCVVCGGYGYIEVFRSDWEEFEEVKCSCRNKLKKEE
jgi:hypothetical protein